MSSGERWSRGGLEGTRRQRGGFRQERFTFTEHRSLLPWPNPRVHHDVLLLTRVVCFPLSCLDANTALSASQPSCHSHRNTHGSLLLLLSGKYNMATGNQTVQGQPPNPSEMGHHPPTCQPSPAFPATMPAHGTFPPQSEGTARPWAFQLIQSHPSDSPFTIRTSGKPSLTCSLESNAQLTCLQDPWPPVTVPLTLAILHLI